MVVGRSRWAALLTVVLVYGAVNAPRAGSEGGAGPADFRTRSAFALVVEGSPVLRTGRSTIRARSGFVTLTHALLGGTDGLEVQFFTRPMTEAARADLLERGGKELRKGDHAALVLFLDKDRRLTQVNLSYVVPGATVGRTVAWKPDELQRFASAYRFDGQRLRLRSRGVYRESGSERLTLSWDVDLDLPVFERARR
jgi:hypothetical protein